MRLVSWNVNGLRAVAKKGFEDSVAALDADIIALQETKLQEGQIEMNLDGRYQFWSYAERKGYSGTAVFTREAPLRALHGLGVPELDDEGRIVALEFPKFWFVDVYTPNAQNELARIDHRMAWDDAFRSFLKNLEAGVLPAGVPVQEPAAGEGHVAMSELLRTAPGTTASPKPVITCGDFNVAHNEIDLKNPGPNRGNAGFSDEERGKFTELLDAGFADTFRMLHPDETGAYSWWSYRFNARKNNAGWRIDYFLVSDALRDAVRDASIHADIMGSDHCPVSLDIDL
ncbi:MAG TPA: exodeoxyribonuclease III [Slackia equolifaciens]|uniref:Exodeoxyribonuclease III n=1 Tax=Slackia equolifaciens TaxID=498718 RepID=A0A9D2UXG6_9ACTN|nr:exodeoxyribonuclease III [Slackia equolifaciens]